MNKPQSRNQPELYTFAEFKAKYFPDFPEGGENELKNVLPLDFSVHNITQKSQTKSNKQHNNIQKIK